MVETIPLDNLSLTIVSRYPYGLDRVKVLVATCKPGASLCFEIRGSGSLRDLLESAGLDCRKVRQQETAAIFELTDPQSMVEMFKDDSRFKSLDCCSSSVKRKDGLALIRRWLGTNGIRSIG